MKKALISMLFAFALNSYSGEANTNNFLPFRFEEPQVYAGKINTNNFLPFRFQEPQAYTGNVNTNNFLPFRFQETKESLAARVIPAPRTTIVERGVKYYTGR